VSYAFVQVSAATARGTANKGAGAAAGQTSD